MPLPRETEDVPVSRSARRGAGGEAGCAASCISREKEWGEEPLLKRAALPYVTVTGSPEAMLQVRATTVLRRATKRLTLLPPKVYFLCLVNLAALWLL